MSGMLLHLAGAVALLIWSVRLIRTGVERAFAAEIRNGLRRLSSTRASAMAGGAAAACGLQSATAVAILATGFVASASLAPVAGLAIVLGADVGSALAARILVEPIEGAVPVLLIAGVLLFLRGWSRRLRQVGRIVIGLALVLLSLSLIRESTVGLRDSEALTMASGLLARDTVTAFILGAIIAWAMHSSLAAVLTTVAVVGEGGLSSGTAFAIILGANLGGAIIPLALMAGAERPARRVLIGNCLLRGGGALAALWAISGPAAAMLALLGSGAAAQAINLHLVFNAVVAVAALPMIPLVLRLIEAIEPRAPSERAGRRISALDPDAISDPNRALACASREVLRIGECIHAMLVPSLGLMREWDDTTAASIARLERDVDKMHFETKLYVASLQEEPLDEDQTRRALAIASIATGFEEAGDLIATKLVGMARRMGTEGLAFSPEGWRDLEDFHDRIAANAQRSLDVLMTRDPGGARQVVEEKDSVRRLEQNLQRRHLDRLRAGTPASIETSNLHQEGLRALKQINTAFSMAAYPIAEEAGDLLSSRLARPVRALGTGRGRPLTGEPE